MTAKEVCTYSTVVSDQGNGCEITDCGWSFVVEPFRKMPTECGKCGKPLAHDGYPPYMGGGGSDFA